MVEKLNQNDNDEQKLASAGLRLARQVLLGEPKAEIRLKILRLRATAEPNSRAARIYNFAKFWLDPGGFF